jgi:hypothetical protein
MSDGKLRLIRNTFCVVCGNFSYVVVKMDVIQKEEMAFAASQFVDVPVLY